MSDPAANHVRPTKRCLDDLGLSFPDIAEPLSEVNHQLIAGAQRLPDEEQAGGTERVNSLSDRVWFKCKISNYRGVVIRLTSTDCEELGLLAEEAWWICAAGERQADSPAHDFYAQIEAEANRRGRGLGGPNTDHLLPQAIDLERLQAERATLAVKALRKLVLDVIAFSLHDGKTYSVEIGGHTVIAVVVRAPDGSEAYLAVSADGFVRSDILAIILSAVPGVAAADWQPEPGGAAGITPKIGQVIWSTLISPDSQAKILASYDV